MVMGIGWKGGDELKGFAGEVGRSWYGKGLARRVIETDLVNCHCTKTVTISPMLLSFTNCIVICIRSLIICFLTLVLLCVMLFVIFILIFV